MKMKSHSILRIFLVALFFVGIHNVSIASAEDSALIDAVLSEAVQNLQIAPKKATQNLVQLKKFESRFSDSQKEKFYLLSASSLAFQGKYQEQVTLVKSILDQVSKPEVRASFLYHLSDGYTNLGDYEQALSAMNEGILLLPKLIDLTAKVQTLQAAILLLNSMHAYEDAMIYADRMSELEANKPFSVAKCIGIADRVEINYLRGTGEKARSLLSDAIKTCDGNGRKIISLIIKALAAIDNIDTGNNGQGINDGLNLLSEFSNANETSDYVTRLEEAIARSYLKRGNLVQAERYGFQAYQHAKTSSGFQILEKTSETMAAIKRAQGQLNNALEYYDINLALKKKVLNDQVQKNLAYQRVKFDTQDKANQLMLAEQKNKILTVEKALQQGKNQNLLLLMTLGLILLAILGAWLVRTLQQKNIFRTSSQVDGLTQVSNRSHFMTCVAQSFKSAENRVSIVLFDMDSFKNVNDTFGHAVGDWVLKNVCDTVKTQLRKTDVLGRLGGEEFAICLPNFKEEEAQALAERCRAAIAAIDTNPSGFSFVITASFGVATRGMRGQYSFEETLAAADKALYFAKNEGRNRVSLYQ